MLGQRGAAHACVVYCFIGCNVSMLTFKTAYSYALITTNRSKHSYSPQVELTDTVAKDASAQALGTQLISSSHARFSARTMAAAFMCELERSAHARDRPQTSLRLRSTHADGRVRRHDDSVIRKAVSRNDQCAYCATDGVGERACLEQTSPTPSRVSRHIRISVTAHRSHA